MLNRRRPNLINIICQTIFCMRWRMLLLELLQKISDLNEEKAIINEKLGKIVPELILEVEKNKE